MSSALRRSVETYLRANGRLDLVTLGPGGEEPGRAAVLGAAALVDSLGQLRASQGRQRKILKVLVGLAVLFEAALILRGARAGSAPILLAGAVGLAVVPLSWGLQSLERESLLLQLLTRALHGVPPEEGLKRVESLYWDTFVGGPDDGRTPILFVASEPTELGRLRLGVEFREVREKLARARYRARFSLHESFATRVGDLLQALLDIRPQIVHFSGHGRSDGALCLENEGGTVQPIEPAHLSAIFQRFPSVRCVVLNACYTELQARAIGQHVPRVIGVRGILADEAAIAFAAGFYQALGAGRPVEEAYGIAGAAVLVRGLGDPQKLVLLTQPDGTAAA